MYALRLVCPPEEVDRVTGALWEAGTLGIQEIAAPGTTVLLAVFEKPIESGELIASLERLKPVWQALPPTDWAEQTRRAWPGRAIGNRLFLAAPWSAEETPAGRLRVMHNPGLACGTGEHPCTQLALEALETHVTPDDVVADIGTGSGILAIAALLLGARFAVGADTDEAALRVAQENFLLNQLTPLLVAGSSDCLREGWASLTVANLNGPILFPIVPDLIRITRRGGRLILTGFTEAEMQAFVRRLPQAEVSASGPWRCLSCVV
jgi:ribosomal protein L11 methyltransferase